jgi:hypothetical protein
VRYLEYEFGQRDFGAIAARVKDANADLLWVGGCGSRPTSSWRGEFLDNYARLRDLGMRPFFCVNHGPTTSMYDRDPDGNRVELQIDNFATAKEGQDWMLAPAFDQNPIGIEYDPDEVVKRFKAGVPVAELVVRD